jgi:hypothetical protein
MDRWGNLFVIDREAFSVPQFYASGTQMMQWHLGSFNLPVDIGGDAQEDIEVLEQQAAMRPQRLSSNGTLMLFGTTSTSSMLPLPFLSISQ